MKFKHYATDEIIEVEKEIDGIAFYKSKNKYYRIAIDRYGRTSLKGTSYILVTIE